MAKSIKVLIVEDSEDDALLISLGLKREGYDPYYKRVDTKEEMEFLLDNEKWDIVIFAFLLREKYSKRHL